MAASAALRVLAVAVLLLPGVVESSVDGDVDPTAYLASQADGPDYTAAGVWSNHKPMACCYADIVRAAADTFEYLPKAYDPVYKNPCWRDVGGRLQCMPYFQVLGVSKCGTTDLYNRLTLHPEMEDCGYKGPHFWDESTFPVYGNAGRQQAGTVQSNTSAAATAKKYDGSFPAYVDIFSKAAANIERAPTHITGEASSNTYTGVLSFLRGNLLSKNLAPEVTLAHYLWEAAPFSRFIVLLRDPVTRYKSAFHYYRNRTTRGPGTPEEFHRRVLQDIATWNACVAATPGAASAGLPGSGPVRACVAKYIPQQLVKGMYGEFVAAWLAVFPRKQLLFLRTEDYKAAPQEHIMAVASFLGLRHLTAEEWAMVMGVQKKNSQMGLFAEMLPETRQLLQDFYRPFNARLAQALAAAGVAGPGVAPGSPDRRWLWGY